MFTLKRIYEPFAKEDGFRILIDRLWPRGLSKGKAHVDLWLKKIAPSDSLRKWFHHDPQKWHEFTEKYRIELQAKRDLIEKLKSLETQHKKITILYGAKDKEHNQAVVLREELE